MVAAWQRKAQFFPRHPSPAHPAIMAAVAEVSLSMLAAATAQRALAFGGAAIYYAGLPLALYVAVTRRGLAWAEVLKAATRLPFA